MRRLWARLMLVRHGHCWKHGKQKHCQWNEWRYRTMQDSDWSKECDQCRSERCVKIDTDEAYDNAAAALAEHRLQERIANWQRIIAEEKRNETTSGN